jgi:hypothetical protein
MRQYARVFQTADRMATVLSSKYKQAFLRFPLLSITPWTQFFVFYIVSRPNGCDLSYGIVCAPKMEYTQNKLYTGGRIYTDEEGRM